jgi:hypothetical protein
MSLLVSSRQGRWLRDAWYLPQTELLAERPTRSVCRLFASRLPSEVAGLLALLVLKACLVGVLIDELGHLTRFLDVFQVDVRTPGVVGVLDVHNHGSNAPSLLEKALPDVDVADGPEGHLLSPGRRDAFAEIEHTVGEPVAGGDETPAADAVCHALRLSLPHRRFWGFLWRRSGLAGGLCGAPGTRTRLRMAALGAELCAFVLITALSTERHLKSLPQNMKTLQTSIQLSKRSNEAQICDPDEQVRVVPREQALWWASVLLGALSVIEPVLVLLAARHGSAFEGESIRSPAYPSSTTRCRPRPRSVERLRSHLRASQRALYARS